MYDDLLSILVISNCKYSYLNKLSYLFFNSFIFESNFINSFSFIINSAYFLSYSLFLIVNISKSFVILFFNSKILDSFKI